MSNSDYKSLRVIDNEQAEVRSLSSQILAAEISFAQESNHDSKMKLVRLPIIDYELRSKNWLKHMWLHHDHNTLALIFFNAINKGFTPIILAVLNTTLRAEFDLTQNAR
jgi:hypothetical protein